MAHIAFSLLRSFLRFCRNTAGTALAAALLVSALAGNAAADGVTVYAYDGSFADASFEVESAIVDRGLVIDAVSHVGAMLNRTAEDVGSDAVIFKEADIYQFCSAVLSRKAMEADPLNLAFCPYGIFVFEAGDGSGVVKVGYRHFPKGPLDEVQALLDEIARQVTGN